MSTTTLTGPGVNWKAEWKPLSLMTGVFLAFVYLPIDAPRFRGALLESLKLTKLYAQAHVLLCLVPVFFIAGAISVFLSQARTEAALAMPAPEHGRPLWQNGLFFGAPATIFVFAGAGPRERQGPGGGCTRTRGSWPPPGRSGSVRPCPCRTFW